VKGVEKAGRGGKKGEGIEEKIGRVLTVEIIGQMGKWWTICKKKNNKTTATKNGS